MTDCVYCRILKGELPSERVYEDEHVIGLLDIHPIRPGHTLVIPKRHSAGLHDASVETLHAVMTAVQRIARAVTRATHATGFNVRQNNGGSAGQMIPHFHVHIIPRIEGDGLQDWRGDAYAKGEAAVLAEQIRGAL